MLNGINPLMMGAARVLATTITDDFEGTWTNSNTVPPGWSRSTGPVGANTQISTSPFSGSLSLRTVATYDGNVSYYLMTWTKAAFALGSRNRLKLRRAKGSGGSNALLGNESIKFNTVSMDSSIILSSTDTGVSGPAGSGASTWREHVIDISAYSNTTFTMEILVSSTSDTSWPYFDLFEFYEV